MKIKNTTISLLGLTAATALVYAAGTAPVIITQPQSQTVNEGESVTFSVIAESNIGFPEGKNFTTSISGSVNLNMIWINPGTFTMGSPKDELGRWDDREVQHQVTLTQGYWLGKYEVTQAQYESIMGNNPSDQPGKLGEYIPSDQPSQWDRYYGLGDDYPVYYVTWNEAVKFCEWLTAQERAADRLPEGYKYTLPTEAQWEYACRAGTTTAFNNGTNIPTMMQCADEPCSNLDGVAWYGYNSGEYGYDGNYSAYGETFPVGQKKPNAWGLYDMHGNVFEWCLDRYGDYPTSSVTDPNGPATGSTRVMRGGDFASFARRCRSAMRSYNDPDARNSYLGFRVALVPVHAQALTYQWYKNGTTISGATGSSYTIGSVKASDAGSYTVTVSNGSDSVTSDAAVLTVKEEMSVQREVSVTGNKATVTLTISNAPKGYSAVLEENWQSKILTFSDISNGGTADETEEGMKVSWSGFSRGGNYQIPGTLTYTASVPEGTSATVALSGQLMITTSNGIVRADIAAENVTFTVVASAPVITTQPQSQSVSEGSSVTFSVTATGSEPLLYQWMKDDAPISGATGSSYTIGSVKASDAGSYTVFVSNNVGVIFSEEAVLTLKKNEMSVQREVSVTGNKATVTLTIADAPKGYIAALEENWQSKILTFSGISNGGTATETENGMKVSWSGFDMSGNYQFPGTLTYTATVPEGTSATVALSGQLMITTSNGAVSADIAVQNVTFTVAPSAPVITAQPKSQTVSEGGSVTFSVTATGSAPLLYQWMKDGAVISGATGSSYTIGSVKAGDAGSYVVMIMNAQGSVMSSPATLTLAQEGAPELKLEPAGTGKWKITFTGTLQESTDTKTWKNVSGTQGGTYTFIPASARKFFRAVK